MTCLPLFIQLVTKTDGYGEINVIGRGQNFRGAGIGDRLLQEALYRLSQAGMKRGWAVCGDHKRVCARSLFSTRLYGFEFDRCAK